MNTVTISESLYEDLVEYFDNRADADYHDGSFFQNREMKLLSRLSKEYEKYNGITDNKD